MLEIKIALNRKFSKFFFPSAQGMVLTWMKNALCFCGYCVPLYSSVHRYFHSGHIPVLRRLIWVTSKCRLLSHFPQPAPFIEAVTSNNEMYPMNRGGGHFSAHPPFISALFFAGTDSAASTNGARDGKGWRSWRIWQVSVTGVTAHRNPRSTGRSLLWAEACARCAWTHPSHPVLCIFPLFKPLIFHHGPLCKNKLIN